MFNKHLLQITLYESRSHFRSQSRPKYVVEHVPSMAEALSLTPWVLIHRGKADYHHVLPIAIIIKWALSWLVLIVNLIQPEIVYEESLR